MAKTHRYHTQLTWSGSTAAGYRHYSRTHRVATPPVPGELDLTADPAFLGAAERRNPEQLLLAAASGCQLLAFLAEAARAGIDVLDYTDEAEAEMPAAASGMRITRIVLRPRIVVAAGTDARRVTELVAAAHDGCFIANTLNADMHIEPTVEHR